MWGFDLFRGLHVLFFAFVLIRSKRTSGGKWWECYACTLQWVSWEGWVSLGVWFELSWVCFLFYSVDLVCLWSQVQELAPGVAADASGAEVDKEFRALVEEVLLCSSKNALLLLWMLIGFVCGSGPKKPKNCAKNYLQLRFTTPSKAISSRWGFGVHFVGYVGFLTWQQAHFFYRGHFVAILGCSDCKIWGTGVKTEVIIKLLGLDNCVDTIVGDNLHRGVSGGERKRVTAGEMLVGPKVILLLLLQIADYSFFSHLAYWSHYRSTIMRVISQPLWAKNANFDDWGIWTCAFHFCLTYFP